MTLHRVAFAAILAVTAAFSAPADAVANIASDSVAPLTGSSALIQSALPDTEAQEMAAQSYTGTTADPAAEQEPTADAETPAAGRAQETTRRSATCSKFIPAVAMTVTVTCDE